MAYSAHNLAWLSEINSDDIFSVSPKAVVLAELHREKFPVQKGFVITSNAYFDFLRQNNLLIKISHLISTINFESPKSVEQVSKHIKDLILNGNISEEFIKDVVKAYKKLGSLIGDVTVEIKPTLTNDSGLSMHATYNHESLSNIKGDAVLVNKIKEAWSHAYNPDHIIKRHIEGKDHLKIGLALIVEACASYITKVKVFTYDTKNEDKSNILIDNNFSISKSDSKNSIPNILSEKNVKKITDLSIRLEKFFYFPQEITFGINKDKVFILDTKPLTHISENDNEFKASKALIRNANLTAEPAAAGIAEGPLRFILNAKEAQKTMPGDVIVLSRSDSDYISAIKKASAVITLNGGKNSFAAITARKYGIPAVSNAKELITDFNQGNIVTVNGTKGEVYKGGFKSEASIAQKNNHLLTATKVFASMINPDSSETISKLNVDGVNPLKAEQIFKKIGQHPKKMIRDGNGDVFINKLSESLGEIAKFFSERPVIYRFSDFKSTDYKKLLGGKDFETEEVNPALGFRGAFRYLHDPECFRLEVDSVKNAREKGFTNLHVSIPFVRTPKELELVKKLISSSGLQRSSRFKIWLNLETPSNVVLLDKYLNEGIDGVSIDLNTLTMLMMGVDKDNFEVSGEFNNTDESVLWAVEHIIKSCQKYNVLTCLEGLGVAENSELIKKIVGFGIDSVSVFPDSIDHTRKLIFQSEKSLLLK